MSPAGRLEAFCLKLPAREGQGKTAGLDNYTCVHVMFMCARAYTKHVYVCPCRHTTFYTSNLLAAGLVH